MEYTNALSLSEKEMLSILLYESFRQSPESASIGVPEGNAQWSHAQFQYVMRGGEKLYYDVENARKAISDYFGRNNKKKK